MLYEKKIRGTVQQKLWLIISVKFMFTSEVCLSSNLCLNHDIEETLSKSIIFIHLGFGYLREIKWTVLADYTGMHYIQILLLSFLLNWNSIWKVFLKFLNLVGSVLAPSYSDGYFLPNTDTQSQLTIKLKKANSK